MVVDMIDLDRGWWGGRKGREGFLGEAATIPDAYLEARSGGQHFPAELRFWVQMANLL